MLIYLILNDINGKVYIGKHKGDCLEARWKMHSRDATNGSKFLFHRAIRKYGFKAFQIIALSTFASSQSDLDNQEIFYIAKYRATELQYGYNLTKGGGGSIGFKHSEESKKKMRKPKILNPETKARIRLARIQQIRTPEQQRKAGKARGQQAIKSGQIQALGRIYGPLLGQKNVQSGQIQALGYIQGLRNVANGQLQSISAKGSHIRWHVNRGIINPRCKLCR